MNGSGLGILFIFFVAVVRRMSAVNQMVDEPQAAERNGHGGKGEAHASPREKRALVGLVVAQLGAGVGDRPGEEGFEVVCYRGHGGYQVRCIN